MCSAIVFAIFDDHNAHKAHNPEGNLVPFQRIFGSAELDGLQELAVAMDVEASNGTGGASVTTVAEEMTY